MPNLNLFHSPAWLASLFCTRQIPTTIPGISDLVYPSLRKLQKTLDHRISYQVDCSIYTNVSESANTKNGGAAAILSIASPTQPAIVSTIKIKGGASTSSYEEEISAMEAALHRISILICTDRQSLCEALSSCNLRTSSIRQCISSILSSILIQWLRWHFSTPGNELADGAAKEATTIESDTIHSIPFLCTFQVINDLFYDDPPSGPAQTKSTNNNTLTYQQLIQNRRDDVLAARPCSGLTQKLILRLHHVRQQSTHYKIGLVNCV